MLHEQGKLLNILEVTYFYREFFSAFITKKLIYLPLVQYY